MEVEARRLGTLLEIAAVQAVNGANNIKLSDEHQRLVDLAVSGALEVGGGR
jgi:hypothetical protein